MKATLLQPSSANEGHYAEQIAMVAARRCRSTKSLFDLRMEVQGYSEEKVKSFLKQVIFQDWAADVLEMVHLVYDVEGIPMWMVVELLRHRLLAREFSLEQLSQRAIESGKLEINVPEGFTPIVQNYLLQVMALAKSKSLPPEELRKMYPQGVLVNFVIGGNLRAFHHFFFMRSSELYGGKGGAHKDFMRLADQMQSQAKVVLPNLMEVILKA